MSKDPYVDVKREVEISLGSIQSLARDHRDLYNPSTLSSAVLEAQEELRNTLSILESDAEDLEESVRVVEDMGERWGLNADEVSRRRQFVQKVKLEVDDIRNRVHRLAAQSKGKGKQLHVPYRDSSADLERGYDEDNDEMRRWEAQEQEVSHDAGQEARRYLGPDTGYPSYPCKSSWLDGKRGRRADGVGARFVDRPKTTS
ncbi:hypothetical protein L198_04131 [Cryptococcus wingfieldii CBS 7118]|uniref:Syntaxin 6/10/61 N-terminal domain-containing protein n=1 Tax=Cryptococcus wingfieldii CBS 7118 TaxID=1295528 RepID=A0A1E3J6D5_9TREE|nr:hypothetical protein L198_04131 [Cryptococcus wingfieldii CBS 7118]ODN96417.1 hypothetical protein L198_04131 [Cryptococcus wingfieldii CBS 7118]